MKKSITFSFCVLVTMLSLFSCQNEENETIIGDEETTLSKSAPLTGLLQRVAMVDVSSDNAIDSTNCFTIKMPYNVIVNQQTILIDSPDDIQTVEEMLTPVSSINIVFPVTVIFADGEQSTIQNQEIMDAIISDCEFGFPNQEPLNCININYPITIFGYNSSLQLASTNVIQSDQQLFQFLQNLQTSQFYALNFPFSVTMSDGSVIVIDDNNELLTTIQNSIGLCATVVNPCPNPKILTDSLVVYIPFGNETKNLTNRGTLHVSGNYHYVTDRNGNANGAFSFDDGTDNGSNSIDIGLGTALNNYDDIMRYNNFTFSLWVKRQDNSGANPNEMIIGNLAFTLFMGITQDPSIKAPMLVFGNNIDSPINDSSWINQGLGADTENWHHLVVSYNGNQNLIQLYRNGVLVNALSPNGMEYIPRIIFGNRYKGYMDDIRVYNKLLSDSEIQQLYQLDGDIYTCLN